MQAFNLTASNQENIPLYMQGYQTPEIFGYNPKHAYNGSVEQEYGHQGTPVTNNMSATQTSNESSFAEL